MPASLTSAIDELDAVFATVPRPVDLSYCGDCCFSAEEAQEVLAPVPLRGIPLLRRSEQAATDA